MQNMVRKARSKQPKATGAMSEKKVTPMMESAKGGTAGGRRELGERNVMRECG